MSRILTTGCTTSLPASQWPMMLGRGMQKVAVSSHRAQAAATGRSRQIVTCRGSRNGPCCQQRNHLGPAPRLQRCMPDQAVLLFGMPAGVPNACIPQVPPLPLPLAATAATAAACACGTTETGVHQAWGCDLAVSIHGHHVRHLLIQLAAVVAHPPHRDTVVRRRRSDCGCEGCA